MTQRSSISLWAFFYIFSFSVANSADEFSFPKGNFQILNSSTRSLTLQFMPQNWNIDSLFIDGQLYLRYTFNTSEFYGNPGGPTVPTTSTVI